MKRRPILVLLGLATLLVALIAAPAIARIAADWFWFDALGFEVVFLKTLGTKLAIGIGVGLAALAFFYVNLRIAQRGAVPDPVVVAMHARGPKIELTRALQRLALPVAAIVALPVGVSAIADWQILLLYLHRTPFGEVDPVFGRDIAYYLFTLPVISEALRLVIAFTMLALFMVVPLYVLRRDVVVVRRRVTVEPSAETHLAVLIGLLFAAAAARMFFVRIPSLVYSTAGPLFGASYTDLVLRAPLFRVLGVVALVAVALIITGARSGRLVRHATMAVALYFGLAVTGGIAAALLQKFAVTPNELVKETPQIESHIAATRRAWGLDAVTTHDLSGEATLSLADIQANAGTIRNVRLWDRDPLLQTFRQIQEIRTYYDFRSVDDDRYWIDGEYRQVLLSPRELSTTSLPTRNFINERLTYTHGMGLTLSPVNQVSREGLPVLFVKDLPPASTVSIEVTRPEVYFGEMSSEYVFVNTAQREFDYPLGDSSAFTVYEGTGGVRVGSILRKLLLSLRFGSMDVLLTDLITPDSRVLYHRNIVERAGKALPFLRWDNDPYLVVTDDGRMKWILDAFTASRRYPYSLPAANGTNYLRNAVKVVIDAYDGDVVAYLADPAEPIIQTYAKIYPDIFEPLENMPPDLRAHIRYAADLFRIQTELYTIYHMDQADIFYAREDQWQIPNLSASQTRSDPFLRHIVMRLPGEPQEEYITMTPFTPRGKDNLAAWMVARSDGEHYGQLVAYKFPRQSLLFGPSQIVNRINQDTEISRQVSLWDQRGSEVIRGNLLVIPIEESLIFVQALYLRAQGGQIPELKRVIVAYQNQVVMEETLGAGMARLFGGLVNTDERRSFDAAPAPAPAAAAGPAALGATTDTRLADLVTRASDHYDRALAAQRAGDWALYGEEMRQVSVLLQQLRDAVRTERN